MGLCEMRWKNFGEMSTDDGHKVYFSGEESKHEYGVGFLVHKDLVGAVLGFVDLLFYVHGKHLRSCRDGQLT